MYSCSGRLISWISRSVDDGERGLGVRDGVWRCAGLLNCEMLLMKAKCGSGHAAESM